MKLLFVQRKYTKWSKNLEVGWRKYNDLQAVIKILI